VVVADLPLSILEYVDKRVTSLDLGASSSHGELVETSILSPVGSNNDIALQDLSLRLELQEVGEVINNSRVVGTGNITDGGKQDTGLRVAIGNLLGVLGGKSIVPKLEESLDLTLGDGGRHDNSLRHDTGVVVADLPLSILEYVDKRVTSLDLIAGGTESELVDTDILSPVVSDGNLTLEDLTLRLLGQKAGEVILNTGEITTGNITDGREENTLLGVARGDLLGIQGGQSSIPNLEQITNLALSNGLAHGNLLRHDTGVMVLDLPHAIFLHVHIRIAGLDLITGSSHGELVDTGITAPAISHLDESLNDLTLRLFEEEGIEVVLHTVEVGTGDIRHGGKQDRVSSVTLGDDAAISSRQSVVPKVEQTANIFLSLNLLGGNGSLSDGLLYGRVHVSGDTEGADGRRGSYGIRVDGSEGIGSLGDVEGGEEGVVERKLHLIY